MFGFKSNFDITNSSRYAIVDEKNNDQRQTSTLVIHGVTSSDYGTYHCEARNEIGSLLIKAILSGKRKKFLCFFCFIY